MALCMTNISTPNQIETNPRHMGELSDGEAGLIRTLRLWALANAENAHFQNLILEFRQQFPHEDGITLTRVIDLFRAIAVGSERTINHHTPDCPCFTADEIAMVTLVASIQANESQLARKLTNWMVADVHVTDVLVAAGHVAAAFSQNAVELPLRRRTPPGAMAPAANTASRTVH
jgi:hypothetical protein